MSAEWKVDRVPTKPIEGQKPGTSGLRKRVKEFRQGHYLHNFVQAIFDALPAAETKGSTLVLGGDGRYWNVEAIQIIIKICAANGVAKVLIGQNGILSTPAVSAIIRGRKAYGGIILTASHNPGGEDHDFGIKYNSSNGGPALEALTDAIYAKTTTISEFLTASLPDVDLSTLAVQHFGGFTVEVIDSIQDYLELLRSIFDFDALRALVARPDFSFVFDSMSGVTGPYCTRIFKDELGAPASSLLRSEPLPDFGKGHPDPNLTYAPELVKKVLHEGLFDFGCASDGDGDRNMILGKHFFVTPSDSVAVIAANADCIPYFKGKLTGVARSMPTGAALDRVAEKLKLEFFEVPTGWKFFGNLMDAGRLQLCGEESFGTGSDHIREKDGIWAVLCWLSILASKNSTGKPLVTIADIVKDHWRTYGRNFFTRYDYEEVDSKAANEMMAHLTKFSVAPDTKGKKFGNYSVAECDNFEYHDPIDKSVSKNQGIRIIFSDGSRLIFRLSGTGSSGATIRMYIDKYTADPQQLELETQDALKDFVAIANEISKLKEFTGRENPTVIT